MCSLATCAHGVPKGLTKAQYCGGCWNEQHFPADTRRGQSHCTGCLQAYGAAMHHNILSVWAYALALHNALISTVCAMAQRLRSRARPARAPAIITAVVTQYAAGLSLLGRTAWDASACIAGHIHSTFHARPTPAMH